MEMEMEMEMEMRSRSSSVVAAAPIHSPANPVNPSIHPLPPPHHNIT